MFRYLYWADSGDQHPKIERARLDGSKREVLINDSIRTPSGLAIDYDSGNLYWCDKNKIERVSLNESRTRTLLTLANVSQCTSLSVFGNYVYWVDV